MVADDEKKFEESFNVESMVQPVLRGLHDDDPGHADQLRQVMKATSGSFFRYLAKIEEVQQLAKRGVSNALIALGYDATTDSMLSGFSGNQYYVSVIAPSEKRILIVDQTLDTQQFAKGWVKTGLRNTFDRRKITVADFFKFIDISKAFGSRPSIYWLHDYNGEAELVNSLGINPMQIFGHVAEGLGKAYGITPEQMQNATPSDGDLRQIFQAMGTGMSNVGMIIDHMQEISDARLVPLPFDV